MHTWLARAVLLWVLLLGLTGLASAQADSPALLTVAEKSLWRATARHAEVVDFCERLAKSSPVVRLSELGTSFEGRKLPLLILADPPVASAAEAARSNKLVVLAIANIHAGEVDGKEALLMLARELATAKERPLLKELVIVFAPIFNADGNEKMSKTNRPGQVGPEEGMGIRANGQGLDLNRDFVKLESPEVQALVRFFNQWQPSVFVDCHTTNGSRHRYTITYEGPRCPAGEEALIAGVREELLPEVGRRLEKRSGYQSFFYGNFSSDRKRWQTVPATPRYGIHYFGLRHGIGILSESYSYAAYRDRILATRAFVHSILDCAAENQDKIRKWVREAKRSQGNGAKGQDRVALQHKAAPLPQPVTILGFIEEEKDGRRVATDKPRDYQLQYWGGTEPTLFVQKPHAYLFPPTYAKVIENLQRHGLEVDELREDLELDVEVYRVQQIRRTSQPFQKHPLVTVQTTSRAESRRVPARTILVRTAQALGTLAAYLLEPQSEDGLCTWNFFDAGLAEGKDYPVLRLPAQVPITLGRVRPLPEERTSNKLLTYDAVYGSGSPPNLSGSPVSVQSWLDDGEHFLQVKDGRLHKVHALTGRAQPFSDPAKLTQGLSSLPTIDPATAQALSRSPELRMNPTRTAALVEHEHDLYHGDLDGTKPVRLTKTPGREELVSFSPNGQFVAFVREQNLYVVDIATQTERALTTNGASLVSNGKADWVYFEEVFNRDWRAYWWSPDSRHLAFLRFDDHPVHKFTVLDQIPIRQRVEETPYPKAGDPNPKVKLGLVAVAGGPVRWVDLRDYSETSALIIRAGWTPDGRHAYFYVQDRAQTWLDFCTVPAEGGEPKRLFRETTKAWVDDPGEPTYLKDGSFLLASERTGWKHFYHFEATGKLKGPVTSGPWEARQLHLVDEQTGWVYFSGTRDSAIASNLYRVRLDGSGLQRLTTAPGDHRVRVSPKGNFFIDTWSNHLTPTKVMLQHTNGTPARTLDTNPVYALEEYRLGAYELVQIKTPDGFVLEGSVLKPPHFDPQRRYPVWFKTYAGPHAPIIHDSWAGGQVADQVLATMGFLVFRSDPRSASGKGAASTWTAYRQLGVQELKDIESAIGWLTQFPYVDATRIGMSGGSYGGFMTSFAMTHSKLFAAGVATAPVTDWRNYDTIYTERYMNTPQENPEGYEATSVVKAASKLHGKLLLVHGIMDDNVHVQNTVQLIQELQRADKDFEVMVYPRARHGVSGKHYQRLVIDFMRRHLLDVKR